jgi:hypothetical protein
LLAATAIALAIQLTALARAGICAYCKATVTTGQFGWVLNNITQASEWSAAA